MVFMAAAPGYMGQVRRVFVKNLVLASQNSRDSCPSYQNSERCSTVCVSYG